MEYRLSIGLILLFILGTVTSESLLSRQKRQKETIKVTTIEAKPFVFLSPNKTKYGNLSGLIVDILDMIAMKQNYKFELTLVKDGKYGEFNKLTNKWNGMIGELKEKRADVAAAPLTITSKRADAIEFSSPFMNFQLSTIIKKSMIKTPTLILLRPMTPGVWVLTVVSLLVTTIVLFVTARLSPEEWEKKNPADKAKINQFTVKNSFWFTFGTFTLRGTSLYPRSLATRTVGIAWWSFVLLLVLSYAVHLGSFFTSERMSVPIRSFSDLSKQTAIQYGAVKSGSTEQFFKGSSNLVIKTMNVFMNSDPSMMASSTNEGIQRVLDSNGDYAFIMESPMASYAASQNCELIALKESEGDGGYGFGFQKDSKYRDIFNLEILRLIERQSIAKLKRQWLSTSSCPDKDPMTGSRSGKLPGKTSAPLNESTMCCLFVWLYLLLVIAIIICVIELLIRTLRERGQKSIPEYMIEQIRLVFCNFSGELPDEEYTEAEKIEEKNQDEEHAQVTETKPV